MKKCCFAGHSKIYTDTNILMKLINENAEKLIKEQGVKEFWCGNYGAFDKLSACVIRNLKQIYKDITLVLVIPYVINEINDCKEQYYKEYDEILLANIPKSTPKKYHIIKANQYMIDNSDFLISYVLHNWGGAVKTLEYAKKKKIEIINL